jgi:hypothetical protein
VRYMRVLVLSFMVTTIAPLPVPAQTKSQDNAARAKLEEQLWQIEQDWLKAEHDQKMDSLRDLWTDQFFDILPGGVQITKQAMLKRLAAGTPKPGSGAFPDSFKLEAVYGNVALATDHTTLKDLGPATGEYRVLRMFVKEKGKWKVAGAALVRIVAP